MWKGQQHVGAIHRCLALLFSWTAATLIKNHRNITKAMGALWDDNVTSRVQNAIASHGCSGGHFRAEDGVVQSEI